MEKVMTNSKNSKPLYKFFVEENGKILDVDDLLSYNTNARYILKGRAEYQEQKIQFVLDGFSKENPSLSIEQLALFRRSYPTLLAELKNKNPNLSQNDINLVQFVTNIGESIK